MWKLSPATWVARASGLLLLLALGVPTTVCPSCGGGTDATVQREHLERPLVEVRRSSADGFAARVTFGLPRFTTVVDGGETWTRVGVPGTRGRGAGDGEPEIPSHRLFLLVPRGSVARVTVAEPVVAERHTLQLYPHQALRGELHAAYDQPGEPPPEAVWWRPPFTWDGAAYAVDDWFPATPCAAAPCGSLRDLSLAFVDVATGRYNPVTRSLELYASIEVELTYEGGSGDFTGPRAGNPFESGTELGVALVENPEAALPLPYTPITHDSVGAELLILTHPDYLAAANRLMAYKRDRGMLATVRVVNDGGNGPAPDTAEAIDALIEDYWNTARVRPSFLCLIGDEEDIPAWTLPRHYAPVDYVSDAPYGQIGATTLQIDFFSEIRVGRLPARSLGEAHEMVVKIMNYEEGPPALNPLAPVVSLASNFECCPPSSSDGCGDRLDFLRTTEDVFAVLEGQGYGVERLYALHRNPDYDGDLTPRCWRDGTPLPPPLRPEDGFEWYDSAGDVLNAFDRGRLYVLYHDHGWDQGWTAPSFRTRHLGDLRNTDVQPIVVCSCCSSGYFDGPTQGFAEELLRVPSRGAAGVIAWTRMSNSACQNEGIHGFTTALWPDAYPDVGMEPQARLGHVLECMRMRMLMGALGRLLESNALLVAWANARMTTLFGDPSMVVWRRYEDRLPTEWRAVRFDEDSVEVEFPEDGVEITAVEPFAGSDAGDDRPIGRAVVRNGRAVLRYVMEPVSPTDVVFYARGLDRIPVRLSGPLPVLAR